MPAFKRWLAPQEIRAVVVFLRRSALSSARPGLRGSASQGRVLFFGKAACAGCHTLNGKGGFLGSDLTDYGRRHSELQAQQAILHPARLPGQRTATVTTKDGQQWSGVVRNEDNFSIQLLDRRGVFHLLRKSELVRLTRDTGSAMPQDYGLRLTAEEINDLAVFLAGRHVSRH